MPGLRSSLRRRPLVALLILILLLAGGYIARAAGDHSSSPAAGKRPSATATASASATPGAAGAVPLSGLPPAARSVVAALRAGTPLPAAETGTPYPNSDGQLPAQPSGYYRQYPVDLSGHPGREGGRVVAARDGSYYYGEGGGLRPIELGR